MKFIRKFSSETEMNDVISQIKNSDEIFIFTTNQLSEKQNVVYIPNKHIPDGPDVYKAYPVNMSPVKLDSSSIKKKPAVGDVLYSTSDGKLTLDAQTNNVDNIAIAICVIPEVLENFSEGDDSTGAIKTARFASINYMNYNAPAIGNKDYQWMMFGNYDKVIGNVKGGTSETSYIGGKWNTKKCLYACTKENKDLTNGVTSSVETGYCAPACCCVAYSTHGTKQGDWYLPMPGELYQIFVNKAVIDEKRTTLVGKGFYDSTHWSCREYDSKSEYFVGLTGYVNPSGKFTSNAVLAFLALEY